jgi:hypothetical protein
MPFVTAIAPIPQDQIDAFELNLEQRKMHLRRVIHDVTTGSVSQPRTVDVGAPRPDM